MSNNPRIKEINARVACLTAQAEGLFRQCYSAATQSILAPHHVTYGKMIEKINELFTEITKAMEDYGYEARRLSEEDGDKRTIEQ